MSLKIIINFSKLNNAISSFENIVILSVLNHRTDGISEEELIIEASKNFKSLITEQNFKNFLKTYLFELMMEKLIEFREGKYRITSEGKNTYSLVDMPLNHIIKKYSEAT